ncbi:bile acid:sodium symporter family protein [Tundrisphaera lichenicola]|uniref:bile acid:sodium symporter family protein n=1 Tax=Tundrisphaera lichenicola TaxID=2029860 RepID=UPI003EBFABD6
MTFDHPPREVPRMRPAANPLDRISHFVHDHFLGLLLATYAIAALGPGPGMAIRSVSLGRISLMGEGMNLTLPSLMLGFLLLNAGLGVKASEFRNLAKRPAPLGLGLLANLIIPITYIFGISWALQAWHNNGEVQAILVGLALVASMPIAGSSTAWSQNADGDLALSLGLVVASTLLSPLATPLALHAVGFMAEGDYAEDLHELAAHGSGIFLAACVVIPSMAGIAIRLLLGEARLAASRPYLKLANSVNLLVLSYSNAAAALPQAVADPDWDFLGAILAITSGLCVLAFGSGRLIAGWLGADASTKASLMYGLGMNNNGTGLVLASMALADHPRVMLPIIFYNLVQQVVAGAVGRRMAEPPASPSPEGHAIRSGDEVRVPAGTGAPIVP